jgi:hypothetical protein
MTVHLNQVVDYLFRVVLGMIRDVIGLLRNGNLAEHQDQEPRADKFTTEVKDIHD